MTPLVAARAWRLQPDLVLWLGAIAAAWVAAYWLEASGVSHVLHHHTIFHSGQIATGGLALLGAWQVMTAAMMLPGALPAVRRVGSQSGQVVVLLQYFAAWTAFAAAAFGADMALHALVHAWPVAAQHENLIPAAVLGIAAAYQLTPWKRDSLDACRRSAAGLSYAMNCVASGWALMLLMFSAGVANVAWMVALTLAILAEKTLASPNTVRRLIALALAVLSVVSLA